MYSLILLQIFLIKQSNLFSWVQVVVRNFTNVIKYLNQLKKYYK